MELKPIRDEASYCAALAEMEALWNTPDHSTEADRLEVLALLVETYENTHYPIAAPDPIAFLEYVMESRNLSCRDLEPYIGQRCSSVARGSNDSAYIGATSTYRSTV